MPIEYPSSPPLMHLRTTSGDSVGFNPNLYRYLGLGQEGDREIYSVLFGVFSFLNDEQAGGTMVTTLYPSSSACEHTKHDIHYHYNECINLIQHRTHDFNFTLDVTLDPGSGKLI